MVTEFPSKGIIIMYIAGTFEYSCQMIKVFATDAKDALLLKTIKSKEDQFVNVQHPAG